MKDNDFGPKVNTKAVNMKHIITGSCDKVFYYPGERVFFSLFVKNDSNSPIKLSNFTIIFDFGNILFDLEILLPVRAFKTNNFSFALPMSINGDKNLSYFIRYIRITPLG